MLAKGITDDFGGGNALVLGSAEKPRLQIGVEADGFNGRGLCAKSGTSPLSATGDDLIDVVSGLGFFCKLLD